MNKIKIFNKLVRDKIPEIIAANGSKAEIKILNDCWQNIQVLINIL